MSKKAFRRIKYVIGAFAVAFCVLVNVNAPTLYHAAGETSIAGFYNPVMYHQRFNQGQLFTNASVSYETNTTSNFYSYAGRLDNYSPNMRFLIRSSPMGASSNPDHSNFYGKRFTWTFFMSAVNANNSKASYIQDVHQFQNVEMLVYYQDGSTQLLDVDITGLNSSNGLTITVEFSGFQNKLVNNLNLYLYFDFFTVFGIDFDNQYQNAMNLYIGSFSWSDTTPEAPNINVLPDFELPDVDTDGLPVIDEYLPDQDNVLVDALSGFFNMPPVFISLTIVSVIGLVSYVLFGKR